MKTKLATLCILALMLLAGALWFNDWLAIDGCLDHGGQWDHSHSACMFHR